ncbi:hypothetical protein FNV43_RR17297 [Rhamnella rubrinervis]|uniref:Secreted protein n=1 Tax=Rhamnella rubrinervis TaxID=2594499 RepID=A0A8K0DWU5_9ROSA|nr:hypothetical protein FNV43_RR17297 [Rhamnella rubrinervis]
MRHYSCIVLMLFFIMLILFSEFNLVECRTLRSSKLVMKKYSNGRRLVGIASFSKASKRTVKATKAVAKDDHQIYTMSSGPSRKGSAKPEAGCELWIDGSPATWSQR